MHCSPSLPLRPWPSVWCLRVLRSSISNPGEMTMITAEKCRIHATECRVRASSIDIPAERSIEQSIMALNWEALADQIDHDHSHGTPAAFSVSNLSGRAGPKGCGTMPKYFFVVR